MKSHHHADATAACAAPMPGYPRSTIEQGYSKGKPLLGGVTACQGNDRGHAWFLYITSVNRALSLI